MQTNIGKVAVTIEQPAIEVPFYKTENSLICTIMSNGHPLGKRLDKKSRKGDIEIEIYAPYETACFIRRHPNEPNGIGNRLDYQLYGIPSLTGEFTINQKLTIANIFAQKQRINDKLSTLMLPALRYFKLNDYNSGRPFFGSNRDPILGISETAYSHIKVIDCTNYKDRTGMPDLHTHREQFHIRYCDKAFSFILTPISAGPFYREHKTGEFIPWDGPSCTQYELEMNNLYKDLEHEGKMYFHASVAKGGEFEKRCFPSEMQKFHIQCGEFDLFELYDIDEALLFLEVISPFLVGEKPRYYWTLALVRNQKHEDDLQRIFLNRLCWLRKQK
ncbi:MAG: hypothetical protein UX07_C0012G0010 [Parcubacteria group bacterium GW2011_GWA2_45_30]|nr:MAG: hypothetical protein UX07_C0012G0010 [Parcubacteria group bacterium GW2011_GWA2_45_30]